MAPLSNWRMWGMGETRSPYLTAVGRSGPAFGQDSALGRRRSEFEALDRDGGVRRAVVDLGGLPGEGRVTRDEGRGVAPASSPLSPRPCSLRRRDARVRLAEACRLLGLALPHLGFVWEPSRDWAFDLAWPSPRVAVEIDGGRRIGGRDVPGAGWIRDAARLNAAAIEGWMVLRVTPAQIADSTAVRLVALALASPWRRLG